MHKIVRKLLATSCFIVFSLFATLFSPRLVQASELIGTHLGEGDVSFQINIIRNVLIPNGLEPGSPVTVMIPVTMLQPSQIGTVQQLADAVNAGGFFPIVRINGVCENFSSETGLDAGQSVDAARGAFGSDALIVWGNEVNNGEVECANWQKYLQDYIQIEGRPNVSPAALDYYMGNPSYTVDRMFSETPGMEAVFNTAPRAANAYGCVGSNSVDCDPLSTNTQQVGYQAINGPVYLTEFSLSPEGNSSDAPDTDIQKVLDFIETRAGETGAIKITPLVRNVCNNESTWLLYVNGRLFTPLGTEVSENCEGATGGSGYDLGIYPYYDVDETKFYLSPIKNLINSGSSQRTVDNLRRELALQGYEAYCAADNVLIEPRYDTKALISRYFELYPDGVQVLDIDAVETLSFSSAQYPLWRDVSNKQFLLSSLEEYFGFRDVYEPDPATSVMTSSPINSLLSEPQLCVQGWKNLVAQELACERLENPGECELFTRPIPGTDYTVSTALALLKRYDPNYREGRAIQGCNDLVSGSFFDLGIIAEQEAATLKKVLINTPTYFDRAYRYGFVVAVIKSKDPGTPSGNIATKIFNFFTNSTRSSTPRDEVLVAAFKLPDIGTNKGGGDDSGSQFWSDPLDLTRQVLSTRQQNLQHENQDRDSSRRIVLQNAEAAATQNESSDIFCYQGSHPGGTGTVSCRNELTKAITDIINGNAQGCGETEPVTVIKDIAGLDNPEEPYGKVFNADNGGAVLLNLFLNDDTHFQGGIYDPQRAETDDPAEKLQSLFTLTNDTWSPAVNDTEVDFYLLYPKGFELAAVEEAMKGAFFTKEQIALLDEDPSIIDGFEMTGQSMSLSANNTGFTFEDYEKTARGECGSEDIIDPETGEVIGQTNGICNEDVSISIKQEGAGVGILGGRLGFWMRKVQQQLNPAFSEAWDYFKSCKTTEEFLLGRCTGGNFASGGQPGDTDTEFGYNTCGLSLGTGYCAPENLEPYFAEAGFENPALEADKASRICQRESGSSPYAFNARCLEGTSVDYSLGLFQINMLPRCEGSFKDGNGVPDTDPDYDPFILPCEIVDQERLNSCALSKVAIGTTAASIINTHLPPGADRVAVDIDQAAIDQKADENIRMMIQIRKSWGNWSAWAAANQNGCTLE